MIAFLIALMALFTPLECLGDVDAAVFIDNQLHGHAIDEWQPLAELTGRDIWIGYDAGGFDLPDGIHSVGRMFLDGDRQVWVWGTDDGDELYLFVFANMDYFCDNAGDHCGIHPCAAGAVEKQEFLRVIGGG